MNSLYLILAKPQALCPTLCNNRQPAGSTLGMTDKAAATQHFQTQQLPRLVDHIWDRALGGAQAQSEDIPVRSRHPCTQQTSLCIHDACGHTSIRTEQQGIWTLQCSLQCGQGHRAPTCGRYLLPLQAAASIRPWMDMPGLGETTHPKMLMPSQERDGFYFTLSSLHEMSFGYTRTSGFPLK